MNYTKDKPVTFSQTCCCITLQKLIIRQEKLQMH